MFFPPTFFTFAIRTYVAVGTYLKQLIMMFPLMIDSSHWKRVQLVECNLQNKIKRFIYFCLQIIKYFIKIYLVLNTSKHVFP